VPSRGLVSFLGRLGGFEPFDVDHHRSKLPTFRPVRACLARALTEAAIASTGLELAANGLYWATLSLARLSYGSQRDPGV